MGGGDSKHEPDGGHLDDCGEDAVEINAKLLRIAVCHEPRLEFLDLAQLVTPKSCVELSYDPVSFKKTKHILRAAEGLRDFVARQVFVLVFVTGDVNIADILTKAQAPSVFVALMRAYAAYTGA